MNQFPHFRGCSRINMGSDYSRAAWKKLCVPLGGDSIKFSPWAKRLGVPTGNKLLIEFFDFFQCHIFRSALRSRKHKSELKNYFFWRIYNNLKFAAPVYIWAVGLKNFYKNKKSIFFFIFFQCHIFRSALRNKKLKSKLKN